MKSIFTSKFENYTFFIVLHMQRAFNGFAAFGNTVKIHIDEFKEKQKHSSFVRCDQREYLKRLECASIDPLKFVPFIVDGADQAGLGLPHFTTETEGLVGTF